MLLEIGEYPCIIIFVEPSLEPPIVGVGVPDIEHVDDKDAGVTLDTTLETIERSTVIS